jgi:hypothetical protein
VGGDHKTGNFEIHGSGEDRRTARRNAINKAKQGFIRPGGEVVPILSEEELRQVRVERAESLHAETMAENPELANRIEDLQMQIALGGWYPIMKVSRRLIWWAIAMGAVWLLYKVLGLNFF